MPIILARPVAYTGIPALRRPMVAVPLRRHLMFGFIAAERDSEHGIVSVCDRPRPDIAGNCSRILRVNTHVPIRIFAIWRIKENTRDAVVLGWRRTKYPLPAAAAN